MTFKDKSITKLYAFAMAAVFALVLAGCGGGGGSATAPDPEPPTMPEPTPQEMCEGNDGEWRDGACVSAEELAAEMAEAKALSDAQDAAMAAYMAAMAAVGGAKDPVAMGNAQPHAAMAKEASDMAAAATTSEMAMEYQMKAEAARDMAMEAGMARGLGVTMLANKQLNGEDIANAELEGKDPPKSVSNAANVGIAMANAAGAGSATVATVAGLTNLSASSDSTTTPAEETGTNAAATVSMGVSPISGGTSPTAVVVHKAGGSTFALNLGGSAASPSVANTERLVMGETPSRFQTKGGWEAQDLVTQPVDGANVKSHLVVNTDIQAPTQNYVSDATVAIADITATNGVIVAGEVAGDGSNFAATFNQNPADNNPPVAGQFQCAGASASPATTCSISVDASGKIVANTGYSFHKSDGTTKADSDYLAWGFWVTGSTRDSLQNVATNGVTSAITADAAQAGAFAYGNQVFTVTGAHKGTATYNGVASGAYSAAGMVEYFDADATLNANFGGAEIAATNLLGAVTGSISNIRAGGMDVEGSLTLGRATITVDTDATGDLAGTSALGFGDKVSGTLAGRAMAGKWGGQFYGSGDHPTTAAGTFAAEAPGHSGDPVRILGSFGTWRAE